MTFPRQGLLAALLAIFVLVACAPQDADLPRPPATPTGLTADPGDGEVTLSWEPNTEDDLAHYNVYRGEDSDDLGLITSVPAGTEAFLDTDVSNDVTLFYAIDGENQAGERSPRTDIIEVTPRADDDEEVAPEVVSSNPQEGDEDVALNTPIQLGFATSMNEGATEAAFEAEPSIDCVFEWNDNSTRLTCRPGETLEPNTAYTITIGTDAQDLDGNLLEQTFRFRFATGDEVDDTPPEVMSTEPEDSELDVALNTNIRVTFSEPMNEAATEAAFETEPEIERGLEWNEDSTQLTARLQDELEPETEYTITIGTNAADLVGNNLEQAFSFSFTTGADALEVCVFGESTFDNCVFGQ